jgi:mRNA interferase HigB
MLIVYLEKLNAFAKNHANARKNLATWKATAEEAEWKNKQDVLNDFPRAKMIANNRARFEIVHNTFRLIALIDYDDQIEEIRFIGTHYEYDRIDPVTI